MGEGSCGFTTTDFEGTQVRFVVTLQMVYLVCGSAEPGAFNQVVEKQINVAQFDLNRQCTSLFGFFIVVPGCGSSSLPTSNFAWSLKGQLWLCSTLSLSILIRDIMWNSTICFFSVLCVSELQLQNLLFTGSRKNYKLFTLHLFPSQSRWARAMFVLRGFYGSGRPKTARYWKIHNIK